MWRLMQFTTFGHIGPFLILTGLSLCNYIPIDEVYSFPCNAWNCRWPYVRDPFWRSSDYLLEHPPDNDYGLASQNYHNPRKDVTNYYSDYQNDFTANTEQLKENKRDESSKYLKKLRNHQKSPKQPLNTTSNELIWIDNTTGNTFAKYEVCHLVCSFCKRYAGKKQSLLCNKQCNKSTGIEFEACFAFWLKSKVKKLPNWWKWYLYYQRS